MEGSRLFNPGWHLARDLKAMLTVSEAVARERFGAKESRGAHSRIDYPNYDEDWGKQNNIIVQRWRRDEVEAVARSRKCLVNCDRFWKVSSQWSVVSCT